MSRTQRLRPPGALVAATAVVGALALAGCGAGQITQTNTQIPAVVGANGNVGPVAVRNAQIKFDDRATGANIYPAGGTAPLEMTIANSGEQPDKLISASSPAAASVEITGNPEVPAGRILLVGGPEGAEAPAPPASAAPSGSSPTTSAGAPTPSSEPAAPGDEIGGAGQEQGGPAVSTAVPATPSGGDAGEAALGNAQVVLTGLKQDVRAGLTYPLVLNFQRAGQVTVQVPVGYPDEPREDEPA